MNNLRVIHAVFKKEFVQFTRYKTWFISFLIWPLMFPLLYIVGALGMAGSGNSGFEAFKNNTGTGNFPAFIVVGTMTWMWVNTTMWGFGTFLRQEQMRGTLESNWLCPIKKINLLIGGGLISLFQAVLMSIISIVEYKYIYGIEFTGNIGLWVVAFLILIPGVYGLGMLFASLILWVKQANSAVNVVRGIVMVLCGITFPISIMPLWMQNISKFIPFTYGIEVARKIMVNGESLSSASNSIIMCLLEGIVLIILGIITFGFTERKVKNCGSLERF